MFFDPPSSKENCYRFVYYPPGIDLDEKKFTTLNDDGFLHAGVVVIPKKTKTLVEKILAEILEIKEFLIPLETDIGSAIENKLDKLHNDKNCSKYCRCKFTQERYWGHNIYHRILAKYAELIKVKKRNLIEYNYDLKLEEKIKNVKFGYIGQYEWHDYRKIAPIKGSLEFIMSCIIEDHQNHFKLGKVNELSENTLKDEMPFTDCRNKKCKFENGKPKLEWESETVISTPNEGYTSDGLLPHKLPITNYGRKGIIEYPKATIEKMNCICSSDKNIYRLVKNEFKIGQNETFNTKTIKIIHDYKDYRELELTKTEQFQKLFSIFYSDILPKKQAHVASKILHNEMLNNAERHSKFLLKNKLDDLERVVSYWPDLERLRGKVNTRKRGKLKEVKN